MGQGQSVGQKSKNPEILAWVKANITPKEQGEWDAWLMDEDIRRNGFDAMDWPSLSDIYKRLSPLCTRNLKTFGGVAAEDDSILNYFLTTPAVKEIRDGEVLLVLGRKGSGKTALVRHFTEGEGVHNSSALTLGSYPWLIHEQRNDATAIEVEAYVSSWNYLIAVQLAALLMKNPNVDLRTAEANSINEFLRNNYGGIQPDLGDILRPSELKLSKASFEPQVLGCKLGNISLERSNPNAGRELKALTDALLDAIQTLGGACGIGQLSLHFDELDLGLVELNKTRTNMLIGLILAALKVFRWGKDKPVRCCPVVYLRTDLWEELGFSDKNKITQGKTLNLEWTSDSLLALVDERIRANISSKATWATITSPSVMRGSQAKWDHILARTFLRPRDVISFLNIALSAAIKRDLDPAVPLVLENPDIVDARDKYSAYLKKELEDEIAPHWQYWEDALRAFSTIETVTFRPEQFMQAYERRKSPQNIVTAEDALDILYRFSVIGYERRSGYGGTSWAFQYTDPEAGWDGSAARLKVHAGLKEVAKLREERTAGSVVAVDD